MTEEKEDKNYDLEDRLIDFAVRIIRMAESLFDILRFAFLNSIPARPDKES